MNKEFRNLERKLKRIGYSNLVNIRYFTEIPDNYLLELINYKEKELKKYCQVIATLIRNNKLYIRKFENITREVLSIIFNNTENQKDIIDIVANTNFIECEEVIKATYNLISINNSYKLDAIYDIISSFHLFNQININNIVLYIKMCTSNQQINSITSLYSNQSNLKNKRLIPIIKEFIHNPNYKYGEYIVDLINDYDFLKNDRKMNMLLQMFKISNINQISLLYEIMKNQNMVNSSLGNSLIEDVFKNTNNYYFKYFIILVKNKDKISDISFKKIIVAIENTSKISYKIEGLLELINTKYINDGIFLNIFINGILNAKYEYQVKYILKLDNTIINSFELINLLINGILNTTHEYQSNCLLKVANILPSTIYYRDIINKIIVSNKLTCKYLPYLLRSEYMKNCKEYLNVLNRFDDLTMEYQKVLFLSLITLEDINEIDINYLINIISHATELQCIAIDRLYNNEFYKFNHDELIKYILMFKDKEHIELFTKLLINLERIGYDKVIEIIRLVIKSGMNFKELYDFIKNNIDNYYYELVVQEEKKRDQELKNDIKKILVIKK